MIADLPADIRAAELALECEVSKTLGAMRFLWLPVEDDPGPQSQRGYIERNAIALLSNAGKEPSRFVSLTSATIAHDRNHRLGFRSRYRL